MMYHIAYIDPNHRTHFVFNQIAVLLQARRIENSITFYTSLDEALEEIPFMRPDLVLIDLRAVEDKKLDGLSVVRILRQHPLCKKTTIVGMADYALPSDESLALNAGCNDFIPKPLRYQAVENIFMNLLLQEAYDANGQPLPQSSGPDRSRNRPAHV
jgi:CheY-like chemotaxis protein